MTIRWLVACLVSWSVAYADHGPLTIIPEAKQAHLHVPALIEASGLAASRKSPDILWSHNDSGGEPVLYAFDLTGHPRGTIRIVGVVNRDWEAIAAFNYHGRSWIAVGEIGDNDAVHPDCTIYVIEEPALSPLSIEKEYSVPVSWSVRFKYVNGPRDCESLLVDEAENKFILITKRTTPPEIHSVPFVAPAEGVITTFLGTVPHLPQPSSLQRLIPLSLYRYSGQPTDGCVSADGKWVALLTYSSIVVFEKKPNQSWNATLSQPVVIASVEDLSEAEGLCFSADGNDIFVTGEGREQPLSRYRLQLGTLPKVP